MCLASDTDQFCVPPPTHPPPCMVVQVEVSGNQGEVDYAQSLMMRAEQLKRDKERMLEKKVCVCVWTYKTRRWMYWCFV